MRHFLSITFLAFTCVAPTAFAQRWEVGAAGGGSFYTSQTVTNVAGNASAGLAPGFVGLYQVNVLVPTGVGAGAAVPVVISIGGATSNTVTIAVGP